MCPYFDEIHLITHSDSLCRLYGNKSPDLTAKISFLLKPAQNMWYNGLLTPWLMESGGSMPHSQGLSINLNPEPNQPNSLY